jgi:integrase/recombinase XerC
MNAHDYIDSFVTYLIAERHYSEATALVYAPALSSLLEFVGTRYAVTDWGEVRDAHIREWVVQMMADKYSTLTVNKKLSAVRSFYRYLLTRGVVSKNPTSKIRGPKNEKRLPEFVREGDMDKLLDNVKFADDYGGRRDHLVLLLFYSTGIRLAELVGLDLNSVNFSNSTIRVLGKRNKERVVPFGAELRDELLRYIELRKRQEGADATTALLLGPHGGRISRSLVEKTVHTYLSQVTTLKKRSPHVLRHTFATAMLNNGAEIEVVRQLLGHKSITTTEIYTHTTFEELKKAYAKAHPHADKDGE